MRSDPKDTVNKFKEYVFNHTNLYTIDGITYQSALAVNHWDYKNDSNLLVLATNNIFLYVTQQEPVVLNGFPSGY